MSAEVVIRDARLVRLFERLMELRQLSLTLGFQGETGAAIHPGSDATVAQIATYQEFGTIDAPGRGFLRKTMHEERDRIAKIFTREIAKVAKGQAEPVEAMSRAGHQIVELIQKKIATASSWATANAPSTIAKKGHSRVLFGGDPAKGIEPGTMHDSVTWAVRKGGAVVAEGN